MARPIRNDYARPSRNWGKVSAVTIVTHPSAVTITSAVSGSVQNDSGYAMWHPTDNQMITSGILSYAGSSITAAALGLTTIKSVVVSGVSGRGGSTIVIPIVTAETDWTSGVTSISLNVYDIKGTLYGSPASVAYVAVGT
ncbi:MAG: hypothetical protein FVQ80_06995 [Planctomycetes bacterium]|nr:hypothetical protein [Planctomycetota bacterium]